MQEDIVDAIWWNGSKGRAGKWRGSKVGRRESGLRWARRQSYNRHETIATGRTGKPVWRSRGSGRGSKW